MFFFLCICFWEDHEKAHFQAFEYLCRKQRKKLEEINGLLQFSSNPLFAFCQSSFYHFPLPLVDKSLIVNLLLDILYTFNEQTHSLCQILGEPHVLFIYHINHSFGFNSPGKFYPTELSITLPYQQCTESSDIELV